MSEKRYFTVEYDEEWYLFDSTTISEQLVEEQAEYGYRVFANSLSPSEVVDLLNEQDKTIKNQEQRIKILQQEIKSAQQIGTLLSERLKGFCGGGV